MEAQVAGRTPVTFISETDWSAEGWVVLTSETELEFLLSGDEGKARMVANSNSPQLSIERLVECWKLFGQLFTEIKSSGPYEIKSPPIPTTFEEYDDVVSENKLLDERRPELASTMMLVNRLPAQIKSE